MKITGLRVYFRGLSVNYKVFGNVPLAQAVYLGDFEVVYEQLVYRQYGNGAKNG